MTEPVETLIAYTNNFYAVERTLRFFQASFWTASLIGAEGYQAKATHSKAQIHLARRFLRTFKWVDCWTNIFLGPRSEYGAVHENVQMLRDSTLGMYFFLDMLVLPSALGAMDESWLSFFVEDMSGVKGVGIGPLEHTAGVCWFYAILLSIVLGALELVTTPAKKPEKAAAKRKPEKGTSTAVEKKAATEPPSTTGKATPTIVRELITNSLDIIIPATGVGYLSLDPVYVSIAMAASSLITMNAIWSRIYADFERSS
ncbi:uncharacterized protein HMPREF1541_07809 [Cyphellophora europaea CBS 101466]|uniref:Peroxisomal biogenesis factor 11 n=1 Tax=Cyphellophora europaea (strain CBS 101466) TaxID=1220924 RepID=W2RK22_CYPE1|nr:uncharacterized protein HMPREF1541_07809 [Cyphellophora europaea CBS 101466]ETN36822.1 hypothetical protein HMPREF1541_07809 [Cyphellophora europaea CBS 101466]